ncbi:hypothetical protein TWF106_004404 [Orbilia oligospora]|uniref:Clr5 domain-containing protein n=1 Tax=Orbilia oligospora TaxID=2813651 RepID=A0A6G1ML67_ORBOL|nr:hypothetical protein TWF106_004404 [Orbilia oligospora]KAF3230424.1 hypothetical protein TWF191_010309 [Orbilia oligospora]KAF3260460.1 hypothetical protein TWF192_009741 [Orbilia oligospora]
MTYDWEKHKETLRDLHKSGNTYHEIRDYMILNHGFKASINAYKEMLKKQWGWDKYIRGTVAGHNVVKRKSRPKRQMLELDQNTIPPPRELREDPLPSLQGQHNGEQENTSSSSQPFQNTADTQAARNTETQLLEPNDIIDERTWPYVEGSPRWWREENIVPYTYDSIWDNNLGCFLRSSTNSGSVCNCPSFSSPWHCFRYFSLSEKLRLLKNFSIITALGIYPRGEYGGDMMRVLDTTLWIIEIYYGEYSVDRRRFDQEIWRGEDLVRRIQRRVERMGQLVLKRPKRNLLDIIRLGHLSVTLILPTLAFIFPRKYIGTLIEGTASLFWGMLHTGGKEWGSSLRQQALAWGMERHGYLDNPFNEVRQLQDGLFALHWDQFIYPVLRANLGPCENQRTDKTKRCDLPQSQTAFDLRRLGAEILSGQVPFGQLHLLVETGVHPFELDQGQPVLSTRRSTSLEAFVKLWPKDPQLEELQSYFPRLEIPLRDSPGGEPGVLALAIAKFAETTRLLADSSKKKGDIRIALDIYTIFQRRLISIRMDLYIYAIQTEPTSGILSSISMLLIERNMRSEEVKFWETHLETLANLHGIWVAEYRKSETKRDFLVGFAILFKLSTRDPRLNRHPEHDARLKLRLVQVWGSSVPELPWPQEFCLG